MPYTPPSQLSPTVSANTTPVPSRSPSYLKTSDLASPVERPQLPRSHGSQSYLSKGRRSPTTTQNDLLEPMTDSQRGVTIDPHGSMRQSPPPRTNGLIPSGMNLSPPESSHGSDDEEVRGRSRELENLAELQAAISQIKVRRSSSPSRDEAKKTKDMHASQSSDALPSGEMHGTPTLEARPPLSREARKISHSRSSTDSNIIFDPSSHLRVMSPGGSARQSSDEEEDSDGPNDRPPMVRKKSGELVRPALRPASRRRPSSMPGTPTYSKAVHFDSHLEHVRHFLQVDKPLAVSAGSSPVETYESENEFPFGSDENGARSRTPSYEWEIRLANFPTDNEERKASPVFVERVFLSSDNKNLIGSVAVQNLAFQKSVVARFTLDYWKTTSEVGADFNNDVRRKQPDDPLDRFSFSIRLADQANLENKTLFFCVRYNVNGQEHWDSNNSYNYQVDFMKKPKSHSPRPQPPSGLGARPITALPRSRPSPPVSSGRSPIRQAAPPAFDDFATNFDNFGAPFGQAPILVGEPKIKLRSPRSKGELVPDAPMRRNKSSGPMFGHRYDFNSSLTAAKNSAFAALGEQSGLSSRPDAKQSSREVPAVAASKSVYDAPQKQENGVRSASSPTAAPMASKPAAALVSEKPSLTSQSYQELVDKYCFFGTPKSSAHTPLTKSALGMIDGADDRFSSDVSIESDTSSGSSTPTGNGGQSPSPPSDLSSWKSISNQNTRSSSPMPRTGSCLSSRSTSPAPYGSYLYNSPSQAILAETPAATAIHG